jgi:predicted TIM-barrel fold metal-dependent hydrolase
LKLGRGAGGKQGGARGDVDDRVALARWRDGMQALAQLPHVCVKLSMVGYSVPGWHRDPAKEAIVRQAIRDVIGWFGASRCMFASNFPVDLDRDAGLTAEFIFSKYYEFVSDMSEPEIHDLFYGTAARFYRL